MYRDAVPDPMDITKFEWEVIQTAQQVFPRNARAEHGDDAGEGCPVGQAGTPTFGLGGTARAAAERHGPIIGDERLYLHGNHHESCYVLLTGSI